MGIEPYIRNSAYKDVARCGVQAAKGQAPVLVGVMDTCISRVLDRVDALSDLAIDGVVSTVPYYNAMNQAQVLKFYTALADHSKFPVYLYDLAVVTKTRTMPETAMQLWKHPNIRGIKTGNLVTARLLTVSPEKPTNFDIVYSDLDTFDVAYRYGISKNLDGMFACAPKTATRMYRALEAGEFEAAAKHLDAIVALRDIFVESGSVLGTFTFAMNDLGYAGQFHMDYDTMPGAVYHEKVTAFLKQMGEI
jgi:4-hydroxy-tetrahydrodipicolinate synthase